MNKFRIQSGFTLMEIVVATTIFAIVVSAMFSLFNYTLKINRRTEAVRQAAQSMQNFIEFISKEVQNGQIDYGVINGQTRNSNAFYTAGPCVAPTVGAGNPPAVGDTYANQGNSLAVQTSEGDFECFYLAEGPNNTDGVSGAYITAGDPLVGHTSAGSTGSTATNPTPVIAVRKNNLTEEVMTPPNVSVQKLVFLVRPLCDPYSPGCSSTSGYPKQQPVVTIMAQFKALLPTLETTTIYYQTSISETKYDIPTN